MGLWEAMIALTKGQFDFNSAIGDVDFRVVLDPLIGDWTDVV